MNLRVARHTSNLESIIHFYKNILGLDILGEFKNHNDYDGVFLGKENMSWHLEFTVSNLKPDHKPDEDDLLVFYINNPQEYSALKEKFKDNGIEEIIPKNPYWQENGVNYLDPDGFGIIISVIK